LKATQYEKEINRSERKLQFSKDPVKDNFGDLPAGEIPESMKYERDVQQTVISNGIRVVT
jgi:hypothetical protein